MRAGTLRTEIEIVTRVRASNDNGGATYTDSSFVTLHGRKISARETERFDGQGQFEGVDRVTYEVRYYPGITTAMEALIGGVRYRVKGLVDPDNGRNRMLQLILERNGAAA